MNRLRSLLKPNQSEQRNRPNTSFGGADAATTFKGRPRLSVNSDDEMTIKEGRSVFYQNPVSPVSEPTNFHKLNGNVFPEQKDVRMPRPGTVYEEPWDRDDTEENFARACEFEQAYREAIKGTETAIPTADNTKYVEPDTGVKETEAEVMKEQIEIPPANNTEYVEPLDPDTGENIKETEEPEIPANNTEYVEPDESDTEQDIEDAESIQDPLPEEEIPEGWLSTKLPEEKEALPA